MANPFDDFVTFKKRENLNRNQPDTLVAIRASCVLAIVAGNTDGSTIFLKDKDHSAPIGVAENVATVLTKIRARLLENAEDSAVMLERKEQDDGRGTHTG